MATVWLARTAALGLLVVMTASSVGAQTTSQEPVRSLRASINAEAVKLASDRPRRFDASSRVSSSQQWSSYWTRRAAFGAAFGLIGLIVGAQVAENARSASAHGDMTSGQLTGILAATGGGVAFGIWLGGR